MRLVNAALMGVAGYVILACVYTALTRPYLAQTEVFLTVLGFL